ncbi:MAG: protein arginine kinase [Clostridia bacterium]|nr:protein arginine kinase [Clostridia bacterium]
MSWYSTKGNKDEFVFSTRARLARNITGFKFPSAMTPEESNSVLSEVIDALEPIISEYEMYDMAEITPQKAGELTEKHLISPNFKNSTLKRAAFISKDETVSIMVNEEDHVRIQCFSAGLNPKEVLDKANKIDILLRERLKFAFSEKYGYLTSCPTNCGTGLRLSAMVHLPALTLSGAEGRLLRESAKQGMTVRGMYGEGSKAPGHIYQISNQVTLGVTANDIYEKFCNLLQSIFDAEQSIRDNIKKNISPELYDKIYRAAACLKGAYLMSSSEFLSLQSFARLGSYIGICDIDVEKLKKLWIETSPCNIGDLTPQERDTKRAEILRRELAS